MIGVTDIAIVAYNDDRETKISRVQENPRSDNYAETAWYTATCRKSTLELKFISNIIPQLPFLHSPKFYKEKKKQNKKKRW